MKTFSAFCEELIARKLPIQWFGNARADNLTDPAFVKRLRQAGCWMLALGIETESEETRKDMMKRLEGQKIRAALTNMRAAGIRSFAFFILGYPGETPASLERTIDYAVELDPDFANFYPAVPYPGHRAVREGQARRAARERGLVAHGVLVLPAARQRPRRADRDGRDQPRQAALLPAARRTSCGTPATSLRLAITKWSVAWHVASRVLFGTPRHRRRPAPAARPSQRAA